MTVFAQYKENDGRLTALNEELTHQHTDLTQRHAKLNSDYKAQRTQLESVIDQNRMLQAAVDGLQRTSSERYLGRCCWMLTGLDIQMSYNA